MTRLFLSDSQVSDLSPLAAMTAMTSLYLTNTLVNDLSPLAALTRLTDLFLSDTQVSDLSPLAAMTGMTVLTLSNTQVSDLWPLAAMPSLKVLEITGCPIIDLRPARTSPRLTYSPERKNVLASYGLTFKNTAATRADKHIAEIAEIEDDAERGRVLFDYLDRWEVPDPPVVPDQNPSGLQYKISDCGVVEYDPKSTLGSPNIQQIQLHAILVEDCSDLLEKCGAGHNQPFSIYGMKFNRYMAGLGEALVDLQPVLVWKAGNDLRILLREDNKRYQGDMSNTPPLDPDLRAGIESFVATHNALAALHPDLSRLDVAQIDPAERHRLEQSRAIMEELLAAFAAQNRLIMTEIVQDLRDLLQSSATITETALRDLAVGQVSLENLIKAIVAQAVIETRHESFLSKIADDARGAAVEAVMIGGGVLLAPHAPDAFAQLVSSLQPQLAAMMSTWHGADYPVAKALAWVKERIRNG